MFINVECCTIRHLSPLSPLEVLLRYIEEKSKYRFDIDISYRIADGNIEICDISVSNF